MLRLDDLRSTFTTNGSCLYPTYMVLDKILAAGKSEQLPFQLMKQPRRRVNEYKEGQLSEAIANCEEPNEREALEEFRAARAVRKAQQEKVEVEKRQEREDLENFEQAQIEGTAATCECCCDEFAMNRMVHCDGHTFHVCVKSWLLQTHLTNDCYNSSGFAETVRGGWQRTRSACPNTILPACPWMAVKQASREISEACFSTTIWS